MLQSNLTYYCSCPAIYQAVQSAVSVLNRELNTENAYNLNDKLTICNHVKYIPDTSDEDEYREGEIFVGAGNLKDTIVELYTIFETDIENLFCSMMNLYSTIHAKQAEMNDDDISYIKFHLNLNDMSLLTLFQIYFARSIAEERDDYINNDGTIQSNEPYINYSDFDYSPIEECIDNYFENSEFASWKQSHIDWDEETQLEFKYLVSKDTYQF